MDGDIGDGQEQATPDGEPVIRANQRTGTAERQAAVNALSEHTRAGRITTQEYEERSEVAKRAVTWADIDALFSDLPQPHPAPGQFPVSDQVVPDPMHPVPSYPVPVASVPPPVPRGDHDVEAGHGLVPREVGNWLMVLATPVAGILFFTTYQWWWWMLIPVVSMVVYGPKEKGHRRHR